MDLTALVEPSLGAIVIGPTVALDQAPV